MTAQKQPLVFRGAAFAWAALATCVLLLVPLVAMQFTDEVRWGPMDFVFMGLLAFGACSAFIIGARRLPHRYWFAAAAICSAVFLLAWAELAVGVFTHLGS